MPSKMIEQMDKNHGMEGSMKTIAKKTTKTIEKAVNIDKNTGDIDENVKKSIKTIEKTMNAFEIERFRTKIPEARLEKKGQNIYPSKYTYVSCVRTHPPCDSPRLPAAELEQFFSHLVKHFLGAHVG
jgi:hypothetical protein